MFVVGFEKESGVKHWLTAAALAASPVKAKAGGDMASKVREAFSKTQIGREISHSANNQLGRAAEKLKSIRLFGEEAASAAPVAAKGAHGASVAKAVEETKKAKPTLDLKDGNTLEFGYKKFKARAKPGATEFDYELPKGAKMTVADRGGEKSFSVGFEKEF